MKIKILIAVTASMSVTACASFDGMPRPVFNPNTVVTHATTTYPYDKVVENLPADINARKVYRNRVAAAYLAAIDARYFAFRRSLSRGMKGGNIGIDLAVLGLTGIAAVWQKASQELAAAATSLGGARASINRELYFERSLPALVTIMDAQRLEVRTAILRGLSKPESEYTVEELFADLQRYEAAASLDSAIQRASELAAVESANANIDFAKAVELCVPEAGISDARLQYLRELTEGLGTDAGRARFTRAAQASGVTDTVALASTDAAYPGQLQLMADHGRTICTQVALDAFKAKVDPPVTVVTPPAPPVPAPTSTPAATGGGNGR